MAISVGQDTVVEIDGRSYSTPSRSIYDSESKLTISAYRVSGNVTLTVDPKTTFSVEMPEAAQSAIDIVDEFIGAIDSKRAELGAMQNRLESTVRNQANVAENLSDARSRIQDADYAVETAEMTKQNIMQQAASSILANANQSNQIVLSLLQPK